MKKFILFFLLNFFYNSKINNSIVFVDIDFLIQNSTIGKTVLKKLENKDKENLQFLKDREQIIRKSENELKKNKI